MRQIINTWIAIVFIIILGFVASMLIWNVATGNDIGIAAPFDVTKTVRMFER